MKPISFERVLETKIPFDASGIGNPNKYSWYLDPNIAIYYPFEKQASDDELFDDKLVKLLEYFLSLHEADEIYNMLYNDSIEFEQIEEQLNEYRRIYHIENNDE